MKYKVGDIINTLYGTAKVLSQTEAIVFNPYGGYKFLGIRVAL